MKKPLAAIAVAAVVASGTAQAGDDFSVTVGADYSTGKYGGSATTDVWYLPLVAKYETGPLLLKLTAPYLRVTGPGNVIGVSDGTVQVSGSSATRRSAEGQGDIVAAAGYSVYHDRSAGLTVDVTGKIKFATADDSKGLGTGKNDYAIQTDVYKVFGDDTLFATLGWKKMGDPADINFRDPWYASLGVSHKLTATTSIGTAYDYRQPVLAGNSPVSELSAFVSHKLTPTTKIQGYVVRGFSDSSPDWGGGIMLGFGF